MPISRINTSGISDSAVTTAKVADDAVTSAKLDTNIAIDGDLTVDTSTLKVDSTNNKVGIGTSSPENNLHVFTDAHTEGITIKSTGNTANAIIFDANRSGSGNTINQLLGKWNGTSVAEINFQTGSDTTNKDDGIIAFRTSSADNITERMRIENNGEVGINKSSPAAQLHVRSPNMASTRDALRLQNGVNNTGGYFIRFTNNSDGVAGYVEQTGSTAVAYRTSSDHRLKENVVTMTGAIDRVKQLLPKRFNFIEDGTDTVVDGFLAHEAQTVVPEAVGGTHNEVDDDGNPVYQGIDQAKLVPLLTGALKEAIAKIEALETRIEALENA